MAKRRRNFDNEKSFRLRIDSWDISVRFNDHAHINLFDEGPFEERNYMILSGYLESTMSKKVKVGHKADIVLWRSEYWKKSVESDDELSIGEALLMKNMGRSEEKILRFRLHVPADTFEMVRAYMASEVGGQATMYGSELFRNKGKVFCFGFESRPFEPEAEVD